MANYNDRYPLTIKFVSYGHYMMETTRYNKVVKLLTTDMQLIDKIKDGNKTAIREAVRKTRQNDFLKFHI